MSTIAVPLERRLTAYYEGSSRTDQPENIHTDLGAKRMGYRGGLVYGNQVFGWATPLLIEALGSDWVRDGWADLRVVRPVYVGDELEFRVTPVEGGAAEMETPSTPSPPPGRG